MLAGLGVRSGRNLTGSGEFTWQRACLPGCGLAACFYLGVQLGSQLLSTCAFPGPLELSYMSIGRKVSKPSILRKMKVVFSSSGPQTDLASFPPYSNSRAILVCSKLRVIGPVAWWVSKILWIYDYFNPLHTMIPEGGKCWSSTCFFSKAYFFSEGGVTSLPAEYCRRK